MAISIVTLGELHHGVLFADDARRPGRLATLAYAERAFTALPVDAGVAPHYGRIMSAPRRERGRRPGSRHLIAATAAAHRLPLYTLDRGLAELAGVEVVLVRRE